MQFVRMGEFGHFDMLAALVYLVRNIDEHTNPVPEYYQIYEDKAFIPGSGKKTITGSARVIKDMFRGPIKRKHK